MGMKQTTSKKKSNRKEVEDNPSTEISPADDDDANTSPAEFDDSDELPRKKSHKKTRTSRSKGAVSDGNDDESSDDNPTTTNNTATSRHAQKKAAKSRLKAHLRAQIPTHDPETGIPYNKIQVRRMMRRVKHGLSPIPTEEEEVEIRAREKRERMEEEALLYAERRADRDGDDADEAVNSGDDEDDDDDDDDDANSDNGEKHTDDVEDAESVSNNSDEEEADEDGEKNGIKVAKRTKSPHNAAPPPTKKAKRNKPVPPDYICQACLNKPQPSSSTDITTSFVPHWIYDCPVKKTQRGCNKLSKKLRGLNDPPSHKVFVSGLPFDCNEGMVKRFFEEGMMTATTMKKGDDKDTNAELVHCKLLKFEDSSRCKGQAFLTFDSEEGATMAIRAMNGSTWREIAEPGMAIAKGKKKKTSGALTNAEVGAKKELKLKVTKALNRFVTKKKTGGKASR